MSVRIGNFKRDGVVKVREERVMLPERQPLKISVILGHHEQVIHETGGRKGVAFGS